MGLRIKHTLQHFLESKWQYAHEKYSTQFNKMHCWVRTSAEAKKTSLAYQRGKRSRELKAVFEGNKWTTKKKEKVRSRVAFISKYKTTAVMTLASYLQIWQIKCFTPKKDRETGRPIDGGREEQKEREKDFAGLFFSAALTLSYLLISSKSFRVFWRKGRAKIFISHSSYSCHSQKATPPHAACFPTINSPFPFLKK